MPGTVCEGKGRGHNDLTCDMTLFVFLDFVLSFKIDTKENILMPREHHLVWLRAPSYLTFTFHIKA